MIKKLTAAVIAILMLAASLSMVYEATPRKVSQWETEISPKHPRVYPEVIEELIPPTPERPRYYAEIPLDANLQAALFAACKDNGVDPALVLGLIQAESRFETTALNPSGCYGLCQLNPACFPAGLSPADNIRYGVAYLARQIRVYGGEAAGLTAYNAGHDTGDRSYAGVVMAYAASWREIIG